MYTDADVRALMDSYRTAVEGHIRAKYLTAFYPEIEVQISAPLLARAESKLTAAEISLMSVFRGKGNA